MIDTDQINAAKFHLTSDHVLSVDGLALNADQANIARRAFICGVEAACKAFKFHDGPTYSDAVLREFGLLPEEPSNEHP